MDFRKKNKKKQLQQNGTQKTQGKQTKKGKIKRKQNNKKYMRIKL